MKFGRCESDFTGNPRVVIWERAARSAPRQSQETVVYPVLLKGEVRGRCLKIVNVKRNEWMGAHRVNTHSLRSLAPFD